MLWRGVRCANDASPPVVQIGDTTLMYSSDSSDLGVVSRRPVVSGTAVVAEEAGARPNCERTVVGFRDFCGLPGLFWDSMPGFTGIAGFLFAVRSRS